MNVSILWINGENPIGCQYVFNIPLTLAALSLLIKRASLGFRAVWGNSFSNLFYDLLLQMHSDDGFTAPMEM